MSSWHSYPSIYNLGHRALNTLLEGPVSIEEKVDGSQFSFGKFGDEILVRSKGREFSVYGPDKMFTLACEQVLKVSSLLKTGWTYRAEYLQKPKHNSLAYDRTPVNNLIIFDIETDDSNFLTLEQRAEEAKRLGFESIPVLYYGQFIGGINEIHKYLDTISCLGGQKIEGVVIKNYEQFGPDKKVLMGKYVSEAFKEVHNKNWKDQNPHQNDIILRLIEQYRTPARWNKSIQHLKERGELTNTPKDIGPLFKEVNEDVLKECKEEIMEELFKWAWKNISRGLARGLPEYYKEKLLSEQFTEKK
jgi:hypothetical protein